MRRFIKTVRGTAADRNERGDVLVVALVVAVIVVILTMTAITQSVDTIGQAEIAGKQVNSTNASEAGIEYELNQLNAAATSGSSTFNCPKGATNLTSGSFQASYTLEYAVAPQTTTAPSVSSLAPCSGSISLTGNTSYLFEAVGTTTANVTGSHTTLADYYVQSNITYGAASGAYAEALFGASGLSDSGGFTVSGGDAYGGGAVSCNSGDTYSGNYFSSGYNASTGATTASTLSGGCSITGNLTINGSVSLTAGTGVGGYVIATGSVTTSGGITIGATSSPATAIETESSASITNGTVDGNIVAGTTVTTSGGPTINGSIYAAGNVSVGGGTVNGNIYSGGTVSIGSGSTVTGTIYSGNSVEGDGGISVTNGKIQGAQAYLGNITYASGYTGGPAYVSNSSDVCTSEPTTGAYGASSCSYPLPSSYPAPAATPTTGDFVTTSGITSDVQSKFYAASTSVDGGYTESGTASSNPSAYGSGGTYPFPQLDQNFSLSNTQEVQAWLDDTSFCTAATAKVPCVESTGGTAAGSYCNLTYSGTPSNAECIIQDNDCSLTDTTGLWQLVRNMETASPAPLPTVIETNCQFNEVQAYNQNAGNSYSAKLYNSLAIIDTAGFDIQTNWGGFSSGTGKTLQLFMIVPYGSPAGTSTTSPAYATCSSGSSDYGPDINVNEGLTDSGSTHYVEDFLYTPYDICTSGNASPIYGRVYAGEQFSSSATLNLTSANIVPWTSSGGSGGGGSQSSGSAGTPQLECVVSQYPNSTATLPSACNASGST